VGASPHPTLTCKYRNPKRHPQHRLIFLHPCQAQIFAQKLPHGKNHDPGKSGDLGEGCRFFLCEPKMNIHSLPSLWKTPVEKSVDNVENYELSTGISPLWFFLLSCGNPAYSAVYSRREFSKLRVTLPSEEGSILSKIGEKVYNL